MFEHGTVVGQPGADTAGVSVLKKGGNAVDAAVTTALLSGIVAPSANGVGGYGGAMVIYIDGKVQCIDFNTIAPKAATSNMYQVTSSDGRFGAPVKENANEIGYQAISVPGILSGLSLAVEKFGTLSLADVLSSTIRACQKGFRISTAYANALKRHEKFIRAFRDTNRLLLPDDKLPKSGDRGKNPDLGKLLQHVAQKGVEEFYKGKIADKIVRNVQKYGGILAKEDMEEYQARLVKPVHKSFMDYDIYSLPLCSSGPSLLQMCRIAETGELSLWARDSARLAHGMTETIRVAWMDRYRHFGDPNFLKIPLSTLMSEVHLGASGREIATLVSQGSRGQCLLRPMSVSGGTTHISVVDADRNMVSLTLTHGPAFGSFVSIPRMGLIMNAGMSRFDPGSGLLNSVGPGKVPLMNMCPTLILREGQPVMTIGASGGTRIPSTLFQVLARWGVLEEELDWAISAPRVHSEGNEWVIMEDEFGEIAPDYLESIGYAIHKGQAAANVRAIEVKESGKLMAIYDPRMKARERGY